MSDDNPGTSKLEVVASFERLDDTPKLIRVLDVETLTPDERQSYDAVVRNGTPLAAGLACVGHL